MLSPLFQAVNAQRIRLLYSGAVIPADGATWTKIVAQYEAATGLMKILFDGSVVAQQQFAPAPLAGSGESLEIGGIGPRPVCGEGVNFIGVIDEVAVSRVRRYPAGCQIGGSAGGPVVLVVLAMLRRRRRPARWSQQARSCKEASQRDERRSERNQTDDDRREPANEAAPRGCERGAAAAHAREAQRERRGATLGELAAVAAHQSATAGARTRRIRTTQLAPCGRPIAGWNQRRHGRMVRDKRPARRSAQFTDCCWRRGAQVCYITRVPFWDRVRGKPPSPKAPGDAPAIALPATPVDGEIARYDVADAIGSIRLGDDSELRFGRSACRFEPVAGLAVRVVAVGVNRGRVRATEVELRVSAAEHDALLGARDREAGVGIDASPMSVDALSGTRLGVTTAMPITGLDVLRQLWQDAGCDEIAPLQTRPRPQTEVDGHLFQIRWGEGELATVLDTRRAREIDQLGRGFVGFYAGVPERARVASSRMTSNWGFGPKGDARALLALVERLAHHAGVTGVVLGCADNSWLSTGHWLQTLGTPERRNAIPVQAFVDVAFGPPIDGVRRLTTYGMYAGLALPDIEVDDSSAGDDDARYELCHDVAVAACRVLAGEDERGSTPEQTLPPGEQVIVWAGGRRASFRVLGDATGDVRLLRIGELAWL